MGFFGRLFGSRESSPPPRAPVPANKAWIIGAAAWGGVMFECGPNQMVLVLLPTVTKVALPALPEGFVKAIVVCNARDEGDLAATAVARSAGLAHVYAVDPARPVDRGYGAGTSGIAVKPLDTIEVAALRIERAGESVFGRWRNGVSFIAGDAVLLWQLGELLPTYVVGKISHDGRDHENMVDALMAMKRVLVVANAPGIDAAKVAKTMARMGVTAEIVGEAPPSRRMQVLAFMMADELDRAEALAREAIAAGDEAIDMHHQLGMIALMRGDEAAADVELAKIDTPQALTSRAIIASRRGDSRAAKDMIARAVEQLPGDKIAEHARVVIDLVADDPSLARDLAHRFPEHAALLLKAVVPMIDDGNYAEAVALLRRARAWDPTNLEIATELGYALSQLKQDAEAIALYSDVIAGGGEGQLLQYNRGNCYLRDSRFADAAVDFRACLALKADWHEARSNLVSALFAAGDKTGARGELDQLEQLGGMPEHVQRLEQMLGGAR